jgi:putative membrane protein
MAERRDILKNKKGILSIIVIIGVIIIPLMYSYFYLDAFWDPYANLDKLPVAVVNNDTGAEIDGENRNLGEEFVDELLADGTFDFSVTDEADAVEGTEGTDYYAMIMVPEDFSSDVSSATTTEKETTSIIYSPNEKENYLASQILGSAITKMELKLRSSVTEEIVATLSDKLEEVPKSLDELNDGLMKMSDGSATLLSGNAALNSGLTEFSRNFSVFNNGVNDLATGVAALNDGALAIEMGASNLSTGASSLNDGVATLNSGAANLSKGAQALAAGTSNLYTRLSSYVAGVNELITSVNSTTSFLIYYVNAHPELLADPEFATFIGSMAEGDTSAQTALLQVSGSALVSGAAEVNSGAADMATGAEELAAGASAAAAGAEELNSGVAEFASSSTDLSAGLSELNISITELQNGSIQLYDASTALTEGSSELLSGQTELDEGINTAQTNVASSLTKAKDEVTSLDGLDTYSAESVTIEEDVINPISNYGTYFTPYFISLSLWVGALIIFFGIYYDVDSKFRILSRNSDNKIARSLIYLSIGIAQALLLGLVIQNILGLEVNNLIYFYLSICLLSVVSISIVQFFIVHMGNFGKFASIALLIFQLTSCGGTFPMETVPEFFNVLYPYMPMTYGVRLFKEAISGTIASTYWYNFGILVVFLVVFFGGTILLSLIKNSKEKKRETIHTEDDLLPRI